MQLPRSMVDVKVLEVNGKKYVSLTIIDRKHLAKMPSTARVKLRLFENKMSETLNFGTLGNPEAVAPIRNTSFSLPTCQLRIVSSGDEHKGLLLGSTNTWNLKAGESEGSGRASESILHFQPRDISPRIWELDIRDDDYPVVYLDERIPNPRTWVRNDPIFASCVLPTIVRGVFAEILGSVTPPEQEWIKDWTSWADTLMPGKPPPWSGDKERKRRWLEDLVDSFCQRHDLLGRLVGKLEEESAE